MTVWFVTFSEHHSLEYVLLHMISMRVQLQKMLVVSYFQGLCLLEHVEHRRIEFLLICICIAAAFYCAHITTKILFVTVSRNEKSFILYTRVHIL